MDGDFTFPQRADTAPSIDVRSAPPPPSIYPGVVVHKRLLPFTHELSYSVFSLLLDIDQLPETAAGTKIFSHNKRGILSFYDKDHGPRDGSPIRPWLEPILKRHDIDLQGGPVRLLCFPRLWGYVFNPLSVYYCYDSTNALKAVLYEVCNTFGEWHGYLIKAHDTGGNDPIRQSVEKVFHVSPFMPVDGHYAFTLRPPNERLSLVIRYLNQDGKDRMVARHTGTRLDLTDRNLVSTVTKHPMMTWKVTAGIHWEALKLWAKGARYHAKPTPPKQEITS